MLIDTHAHLDNEAFDTVRDQVVQAALTAGVEKIITIGCTLAESRKCVRIAENYPCVHAAVGIQPNCIEAVVGDARVRPADGSGGLGPQFESSWHAIEELAKSERVVAIGETGLDHYWDRVPLDQQEIVFRKHVALAQHMGLPFIVHMRDSKSNDAAVPSTDCAEHIWQVLSDCRRDGELTGVMHSFSGTLAYAQRFLDLGLYISFAGMVTFKKSEALRAVAAAIPSDRILVETDAPYLSPEPLRGKRPNQPAWVVNTAQCIAAARGQALEEFAEQTTRNARRLFPRLGDAPSD